MSNATMCDMPVEVIQHMISYLLGESCPEPYSESKKSSIHWKQTEWDEKNRTNKFSVLAVSKEWREVAIQHIKKFELMWTLQFKPIWKEYDPSNRIMVPEPNLHSIERMIHFYRFYHQFSETIWNLKITSQFYDFICYMNCKFPNVKNINIHIFDDKYFDEEFMKMAMPDTFFFDYYKYIGEDTDIIKKYNDAMEGYLRNSDSSKKSRLECMKQIRLNNFKMYATLWESKCSDHLELKNLYGDEYNFYKVLDKSVSVIHKKDEGKNENDEEWEDDKYDGLDQLRRIIFIEHLPRTFHHSHFKSISKQWKSNHFQYYYFTSPYLFDLKTSKFSLNEVESEVTRRVKYEDYMYEEIWERHTNAIRRGRGIDYDPDDYDSDNYDEDEEIRRKREYESEVEYFIGYYHDDDVRDSIEYDKRMYATNLLYEIIAWKKHHQLSSSVHVRIMNNPIELYDDEEKDEDDEEEDDEEDEEDEDDDEDDEEDDEEEDDEEEDDDEDEEDDN